MMKDNVSFRLLNDRAGNFGIMTAVLIPVLVGFAGVAIDLTTVMEAKNELQALADSATIGAASAMADKGTMTVLEAQDMSTNYLIGQKLEDLRKGGATPTDLEAAAAALKANTKSTATVTTASNTASSYTVHMVTSYDVTLSSLTAQLGFKTMRLNIDSVAASGREGNALSMYLALDESGSMAWDTTTVDPATPTKRESYDCSTNWWQPKTCSRTVPNYVTKIASLKTAAAVMFNELKKADPSSVLIRMGADSYDDKTKPEQKIVNSPAILTP